MYGSSFVQSRAVGHHFSSLTPGRRQSVIPTISITGTNSSTRTSLHHTAPGVFPFMQSSSRLRFGLPRPLRAGEPFRSLVIYTCILRSKYRSGRDVIFLKHNQALASRKRVGGVGKPKGFALHSLRDGFTLAAGHASSHPQREQESGSQYRP